MSDPGGGQFPTSEQFNYSLANYSAPLGPLPAVEPATLAPAQSVAAPELLGQSPATPAPAPALLRSQTRLPSPDSTTVTLVQDVPPRAVLKGPPGQLVISNELPVMPPITTAAPGPAPQTEAGLKVLPPSAVLKGPPGQLVISDELAVSPAITRAAPEPAPSTDAGLIAKLPISPPITTAAPGPAPRLEAGLKAAPPGAMQSMPAQAVAVQESVLAPGPPASATGSATGALFPITQIDTSSDVPVLTAAGELQALPALGTLASVYEGSSLSLQSCRWATEQATK